MRLNYYLRENLVLDNNYNFAILAIAKNKSYKFALFILFVTKSFLLLNHLFFSIGRLLFPRNGTRRSSRHFPSIFPDSSTISIINVYGHERFTISTTYFRVKLQNPVREYFYRSSVHPCREIVSLGKNSVEFLPMSLHDFARTLYSCAIRPR